jgi:hypothetical protein
MTTHALGRILFPNSIAARPDMRGRKIGAPQNVKNKPAPDKTRAAIDRLDASIGEIVAFLPPLKRSLASDMRAQVVALFTALADLEVIEAGLLKISLDGGELPTGEQMLAALAEFQQRGARAQQAINSIAEHASDAVNKHNGK